MSMDLQQALVALVLLVPGFIVTNMQRGFRSVTFSSQFEWFVTSILHSIFLNLATFIPVSLFFDLSGYTMADASTTLKDVGVIKVYYYFVLLYILAILWGLITGKWQSLSLRSLANTLGISPFGEHSSVWDRLFDKQVPTNANAIWIITSIEDNAVILGRLRHSSEIVSQDKPIELYVAPYFISLDGRWIRPTVSNEEDYSNGIYLKLTDDRSVKFFFRGEDWKPNA